MELGMVTHCQAGLESLLPVLRHALGTCRSAGLILNKYRLHGIKKELHLALICLRITYEINTMKKHLTLAAIALLLFSCDKSKVCNHNGEDIPCKYYDLYIEHAAISAQIKATFDDDAVATFEKSYALREQWVTLYNNNTKALKKAYELVGLADQLDFSAETRLKEFEYYKEQKVKRAELAEFMKSLDIQVTDSDTSLSGSERPSLIWTITNNSDKTIKSFMLKGNYTLAGKTVRQDENIFGILTADQILPKLLEGEENHLKPGSSAKLDFEKPAEGEVVLEIRHINFVKE